MQTGYRATMEKPDSTHHARANALAGDLLRSGHEALTVHVFKHLPRNETEFRALVAQRPILMAAIAATAGSAAMQLLLAAHRREHRETPRTPSRHHWFSIATAIWPFVRKADRHLDPVEGADSGAAEHGVTQAAAFDRRPHAGRRAEAWTVGLGRAAGAVKAGMREASEMASVKTCKTTQFIDEASHAVSEHAAATAKRQPVWTLVAGAGAGFVVTWLVARR